MLFLKSSKLLTCSSEQRSKDPAEVAPPEVAVAAGACAARSAAAESADALPAAVLFSGKGSCVTTFSKSCSKSVVVGLKSSASSPAVLLFVEELAA